MFRKSSKNKALSLEVSLTYDENTDSIYLQTKGRSYPSAKIRLEQKDCASEFNLRELLERKGIIPECRFKSIPYPLPYPESHPESQWDRFPLGLHSNGKEAVWNSSTSAHALIVGDIGSGKSVIQRNILAHCSKHSDEWKVLAIDPLRVEFSSYKNRYPELIEMVSSVPDAVEMLRYAHGEMTLRHAEMEKLGQNNFRDMDKPLKSLMIMMDEVNWYLRPVGSRAQDALEENELRAEAAQILLDIARLGRAAGVHLVLASHVLEVDVLGEKLMDNITTRIASGPLNKSQSEALLDNTQATQLNRALRGRGYLQEHGKGADFQSYFTQWKI